LKTNFTILNLSVRKLAILVLLATSTIATFAMLGTPGRGKKSANTTSLLTRKTNVNSGQFSLNSGYQFRGSRVINMDESKYLNVNTTVSYQMGHTTYTMPMKKKVVLNGRVTFNPNSATR